MSGVGVLEWKGAFSSPREAALRRRNFLILAGITSLFLASPGAKDEIGAETVRAGGHWMAMTFR